MRLSIERLATSPTALAGWIAAVALLAGATGCSNPAKKAKKTIKEAVKQCRKAETDGAFYKVEAFGGLTRQVLAGTCEGEMKNFEMPDEFSARAEVGPYTWNVGLEEETGMWVLKDVRWDTLDNARDRLQTEDPSESSMTRIVELLGNAQETYPDSSWIRLERLKTLLDLRSKKLDKKESDLDPLKLGGKARTQFQETVEWAEEKGDRDTEAEARLVVTDYLRDYLRYLQQSKRSLGSRDGWYENAVEQAEEKGNDEQAEKYQKTLKKLKEERPKKRKRYNDKLEKTRVAICKRYAELAPSGIEDGDLKKRVLSAEDSLDCATILDRAETNKKEGDDSK